MKKNYFLSILCFFYIQTNIILSSKIHVFKNSNDVLGQNVYRIFTRNIQYLNKKDTTENQLNQLDQPKFYLKDFLNNNLTINKESTKILTIDNIEPINTCKLKQIEISLLIKDCGRITINSTSCTGLCKSNEKILANTNLKKSTCSACKAIKHTTKTYRIRCSDKKYRIHKIKQVKECSCFKLIDQVRST